MGCLEWNRWMGGMRLKNISLALRQRSGLLPIALAGSALMIACGIAAQPVDSKPVATTAHLVSSALSDTAQASNPVPVPITPTLQSPTPNGDRRHVISSGNYSLNYS